MIFLNFANFLYAEFRISVMSIAKQRLWAFYVMLTLMFEAFIGVLSVFELLSERPDKYLWLITGGASVVFSCFSIIVLRQQFVRALEGGVYTFKITDKSYLPTRLFGEFDTAVSCRPLSAELDYLPDGLAVPEGRVKPWGTCHAVLAAKPYIHGPFAVINADDYYGPEAFKVIYDYLSTHTDGEVYDYCMVSYLLKNTVSENGSVARGVCALNEDSTLHSVTERTRIETYEGGIHYTEDGGESWTDLPGETPVSMNLWGFGESFVKEAELRNSISRRQN